MSQTHKKHGSLPVAIILLVLVVAVIAGLWFYNYSKPAGNTSNRNSTAANASNRSLVDMSKAPPGAEPPNMLGSPTAAVTIEEFADFQCPACAATYPVLKEIQQTYGSRIKFILRHFPLQMHEKAYDAAVAAEAAGNQGKFWDMQNQLFTNQKSWASNPNYKENFKEYARNIGLDMDKFTTDTAGIQTKSRVDADIRRGQALNINSTPTVFLNGKLLPYKSLTAQSLRQLIDSELQTANAESKPAPSANSSNSN